VSALDRAPADVRLAILEFWPQPEHENAAAIAELESGFDPFALNDTTDREHPCGARISKRGETWITAERSVGIYQINTCNLPPDWEWARLYNVRHNCGTAHDLWDRAGQSWHPWYFSALKLGLL
jgi:hypothetical protein